MERKESYIQKKIKSIIIKNRSKRVHNLIGKWQGKKSKILSGDASLNGSKAVEKLDAHLEVNTELKFNWNFCKKGLIQFKQNYSLMNFSSGLNQNTSSGELWMIKKLTFNKLIILQQNTRDNSYVEHYFIKEFEK